MRSGLSMGKQPQIVEIKMAAVEAMVERAKGLLAKEDHDLLKGLVDLCSPWWGWCGKAVRRSHACADWSW